MRLKQVNWLFQVFHYLSLSHYSIAVDLLSMYCSMIFIKPVINSKYVIFQFKQTHSNMLRAAYNAHKGTNHFYFEDDYNNSTDASVRLKKLIPFPLSQQSVAINSKTKGYVYWIIVSWGTLQQLLHGHNIPLDIPLKAKWHGHVDCLHSLYTASHKHYIKENALDEETVSIWALWFFHNEHKCAVPLFASQTNTICEVRVIMVVMEVGNRDIRDILLCILWWCE